MNDKPIIPPALTVPPDVDMNDIVGYWFELPRELWRAIFGLLVFPSKTQFWNDSASFVSANDTARAVARMIAEARESVLPVGTISPFVGEDEPDGFLLCNGEEHLRASYPHLYSVLPTAFIIDEEKFITPDLRNRFLAGSPDLATVGNFGGANSITLGTHNIPAHTHTYSSPIVGAQAIGEIPSIGVNGVSIAETAPIGSGTPFDNRPAFMLVNYIIRARP